MEFRILLRIPLIIIYSTFINNIISDIGFAPYNGYSKKNILKIMAGYRVIGKVPAVKCEVVECCRTVKWRYSVSRVG